jgi:hypothetical protein
MEQVLVNRAAWATPEPVPDGWAVANAPRPIAGQITWQGDFRHGIFYAASPEIPGGTFGWQADDAWLVTFTDNAELAGKVAAKLAEHGYTSAADVDMTVGELAQSLDMPWHDEAS